MFNKIKEICKVIRKYWLRRYTFKKGFKESLKQNPNRIVPWTIYGENLNIRDFVKDFVNLNKNWKKRLLVPLVLIAKIIMPKRMLTRKPNKNNPYHKNLKAFDKAYSKSIDDWIKYFIVYTNMQLKDNKAKEEAIKKYANNSKSPKVLRGMWDMARTIIANDTAYLEFFNILMYNTYKEMQNIYKDKSEINHLLYNSKRIDDINYYILANQVNSDNKLILKINEDGEITKNR